MQFLDCAPRRVDPIINMNVRLRHIKGVVYHPKKYHKIICSNPITLHTQSQYCRLEKMAFLLPFSSLHSSILNIDSSLIQYILISTACAVIIFEIYKLFGRKSDSREDFDQLSLERARINGMETERARIASDLHDSLGNMISTARLLSDTISTGTNSGIEEIKTILTDSHIEMQRIASNLYPKTLERIGLIDSIDQLIEKINRNGQLYIKFKYDRMGRFHFSKMKSLHIYRIIQELTNNTIKHAKARNAFIVLLVEHSNLQIHYGDDGIFDDFDGLGNINIPIYLERRMQLISTSYAFTLTDTKSLHVQFNIHLVNPEKDKNE